MFVIVELISWEVEAIILINYNYNIYYHLNGRQGVGNVFIIPYIIIKSDVLFTKTVVAIDVLTPPWSQSPSVCASFQYSHVLHLITFAVSPSWNEYPGLH